MAIDRQVEFSLACVEHHLEVETAVGVVRGLMAEARHAVA